MQQDYINEINPDQFFHAMEQLWSQFKTNLPASLEDASLLQLAIFASVIAILCGAAFRTLIGSHCPPNQAIAASVGILFIYALTIFIYSVKPLDLAQYLSPLPFADFRGDILVLFPFMGSPPPEVCAQILSLLVLCFIVHVLDSIMPHGSSIAHWLFIQIISIMGAIFLNLLVWFILNRLLPQGITAIAPTTLTIVVSVSVLMAIFKPLLCVLFTILNPAFGLLYTFFFSNVVGRQLTKSVISTALLCGVFFVMEYLGYTVIDISPSAVFANLPIGFALLFLWYIFDYKM